MPEEKEKGSWWQTLPGILTAIATIITAITGFTIALNQTGCFRKDATTATKFEKQQDSMVITPTVQGAVPQTKEEPAPDTAAKKSLPDSSTTMTSPSNEEMNLLSPDDGGQIITASDDDWSATIDGSEDAFQLNNGIGQQAVYGFKDGKTASFHSFAMLVNDERDANIKQFELSASKDSPKGPFKSIGKFTTQNMKIMADPFQKFSFDTVTAKYLKVKVISTYGWIHPIASEFQLWGKLD